jgi:hypothetical protein
VEIKDIKLQLTADEINLLLEGLGAMPFVKVYALIGKIQQQVSGQMGKEEESSANLSAPSA